MRNVVLIIFFFVLPFINYGQRIKAPKNIKEAVTLLDKDCPENLKEIIKRTSNDSLENLTYPSYGKYKTVFRWTTDSVPTPKILKYLTKRGVAQHAQQVILMAFKEYLLHKKFDEKKILKPFQEIEKKWDYENQIRYTTDSLRGIYIPKDINDAISKIDEFWDDKTKTKVASWSEDEFIGNTFRSFGMWIRNNWQLWGGSRLSKYFNDLGVNDPEEISGIILSSYYRHLKKQDINFQNQINEANKSEIERKKSQSEQKEKEFNLLNIGDIVLFKYHYGFISQEQEKLYDDDTCIVKGKIIEKNSQYFSLKIKLLDSCDKLGIISHDNRNTMIFNKKSKKYEKPKKFKVEKMKNDEEGWFYYTDWEEIE